MNEVIKESRVDLLLPLLEFNLNPQFAMVCTRIRPCVFKAPSWKSLTIIGTASIHEMLKWTELF